MMLNVFVCKLQLFYAYNLLYAVYCSDFAPKLGTTCRYRVERGLVA